jgi:hypothetical protein
MDMSRTVVGWEKIQISTEAQNQKKIGTKKSFVSAGLSVLQTAEPKANVTIKQCP